MYYLAYGSNLNILDMQKRCPSAKIVGHCFLKNYELAYWHYLTIIPKPGKVVPLGVWEINEADLPSLDYYEAYPELYYKKELKVKVNQIELTALIYIMQETRINELPTKDYVSCCLKGYNDFAFNTKYLDEALAKCLLENGREKL